MLYMIVRGHSRLSIFAQMESPYMKSKTTAAYFESLFEGFHWHFVVKLTLQIAEALNYRVILGSSDSVVQ